MKEIPRVMEHPLVVTCLNWVTVESDLQLRALSTMDLSEVEKQKRVEMIWSKVIHIGDTVHVANDVADLDPSLDRVLAQTLAVLHDVGRFEQIAVYGDYSDSRTGYDHAGEGAEKFKKSGIRVEMSGYSPDAITEAIAHHSARTYSGAHIEARLLRDIDKLALMRRYEYQIQSALSRGNYFVGPAKQELIDIYHSGQLIPNHRIETSEEIKLRFLSWKYDLNFQATKTLVDQEGLLQRISEFIPSYYPETQVDG